MVNIYGRHFIYDGIRSSMFNLIIANVETSEMTRIAGEKKGNFVFNKAWKCNHLIGDDYKDSPLSFEVDIVTCCGRTLTYEEVREIHRWLFVNATFKKLYIDPADDPFGETYELVYGVQKRLYFNCRFLHAEKLEYNGGVVGFRCTLETDSMMMWQDTVGVSYDYTAPVEVTIGGEQVRMLRGDVDFDGRLTAKDSQMILVAYGNIRIGLPSGFTEDQERVADMDADGDIDSVDAQMVLIVYGDDRLGYPTEKSYVIVERTNKTIELPEGTKIITVEVDSDIDGYTYPTITVWMGSEGGDLTIINYDDDENRQTVFSDLAARAQVTIDSSMSRVGIPSYNEATGEVDVTAATTLYNKMTTKNFPRFVNGLNQISVDGDVIRIDIKWNNRRML